MHTVAFQHPYREPLSSARMTQSCERSMAACQTKSRPAASFAPKLPNPDTHYGAALSEGLTAMSVC